MKTDSHYIAHHRTSDGATQSVAEHLRAVAGRARGLADKIGLADQGELIGLVHDLGKYSAEFQAYLNSAVGRLSQDDEDFVNANDLKGKIDHSTSGAQLVWRELAKHGQLGVIVGQVLALCIASHHSGMIDCLTSDLKSLGEDVFGRRMNKSEERAHSQEVWAKADEDILSRARRLLSDPGTSKAVRDAMKKILDVNPARNDKEQIAQMHFGFLVRFLFSCLIDADRIDTADFEVPRTKTLRLDGRYTSWQVLISRLNQHLEGLGAPLPIDRIRQEISMHCLHGASGEKGLYSLTVPTGGGKTLASLRFAMHHANVRTLQRVFYFIPFTSIIDQNAGDVRQILEPDVEAAGTVVLEHHSNLTPEKESWRGAILTQDWDAPVVFTTNVQFLETFFGDGTRSARRMHQLANAVLIFDEIQTLPINCIHLFNNAINFLVEQCGSTVVLCTATQPLLDQVDHKKGALRIPDSNELMPDVQGLFDKLKRVDVLDRRKPGGWTNEEVVTLALEEIDLVGSCLVIVNTKESARTLRLLCKPMADLAIYHLSTHMCPAHRTEVLDKIRKHLRSESGDRVLCFSTQLIEAGVNVDFGSVIRFAAGLDSIGQAAGRCNRHGRRPTGRVHVVNPRDESLDKLPDIRVGREKAERVMDDYAHDAEAFDGSIIGPAAMRWYYQNYFFARSASMDYPVPPQSLGHADTLLNLLSVNSMAVAEHGKQHAKAPDFYFRQSFMAAARAFKAIDAPTHGVIVPYQADGRKMIADLSAAYMPDKEFDLLRRAQRFSVNVFPYVLERLIKADAVHEVVEGTGILALDSRYYSREFGVSETPVEDMEFLNG